MAGFCIYAQSLPNGGTADLVPVDSGCKATYSRKEKQRALDAKTLETLERLQQQAELKLANMTGLESCPFCDFAAICPPVEVDKEFRCGNPECGMYIFYTAVLITRLSNLRANTIFAI